MEQLFNSLTHAIEGTPFIAISAAFVWGILSIVLSPCHLASIPLIIGFINEQGTITIRRAFITSFIFSLGILVSIAIIGIITAIAGRIMGDIGPYSNYIVAGIFFVVGLQMLGVISMPWSKPDQTKMKNRGYISACMLGLVFGIALGPCTFAFMAPMLAITFKLSSTNFLYGSTLLLFYGLGHCSVIVLAGTFTEAVQRYLNWNEKSRGAFLLKKICGIVIMLAGLYLIYVAP